MATFGPHDELLHDDLKVRKPNFTEAEKVFLVRKVEYYKKILAQRRSSDGCVKRLKHDVWAMIANELNMRNSNVMRTPRDVRKKWQNLLTLARKELRSKEEIGVPPAEIPWFFRKIIELGEGEDPNITFVDGEHVAESNFMLSNCEHSTGGGGGYGGNNPIQAESMSGTVPNNELAEPVPEKQAEVMSEATSDDFQALKNEPLWYEEEDAEQQEHSNTTSFLREENAVLAEQYTSTGFPSYSPLVSATATALICPPQDSFSATIAGGGATPSPTTGRPTRSSSCNSQIVAGPRHSKRARNDAESQTSGFELHPDQKLNSDLKSIEYQRFLLERDRQILQMNQSRKRFVLEQKKLKIETDILTLQKQKLELEVQAIRNQLDMPVQNGFS